MKHALWRGRHTLLLVLALLAGVLVACDGDAPTSSAPAQAMAITLQVDGETRTVQTRATNVRLFLEEQNVELDPADEVTPPLFTPLTEPTTVVVNRITEEIQLVEESIPFARKIVRNESLTEDAPPQIVQSGRAGLAERTVRILYRNGVEVERQTLNVRTIVEAQDEIVMVGIGSAPGNLLFSGTLAFISSGRGLILRGSTAFPEQLNLGGVPDGRVFSLSPTCRYLLYTRTTDDDDFNALFLVSTDPGSRPRALGVANVLWASWNPATVDPLEIAYTTALPTELAPGWEANNDLWRAAVDPESDDEPLVEPEQLVEAYPAKLGWWGGNYAWAPSGEAIAYSYADEVGVLDLTDGVNRRNLYRFVEYDTLSDWVWVPTLSWSPDGRYLAFSTHGGDESADTRFDTVVADVQSGVTAPFAPQSGIWGHPSWSPEDPIVYLRANDPIESLRSTYTLWIMDRDGSNARQLYPAVGENSFFPRDPGFLAWGPDGEMAAFVFNNALYLYDLTGDEAFRITEDEGDLTRPSWAPYGAGIGVEAPVTEEVPLDDIDEELRSPPVRPSPPPID